MIADVTIKDYYLQYISNAKKDIIEYNNHLNDANIVKDETYKFINDNKDIIENTFNIKFNYYNKELINKEYSDTEALYNYTIKLLNAIDEHPNKNVLFELIRYCNSLRLVYKYTKLIELANRRKDIKFKTYQDYISKFYNKVHKCVLEGYGYKFSYGIGTYCINYWKFDPDKMKSNKVLDYKATNLKKKELLARGIKLYDKDEAKWYAERNMPYDGVDYRVYKTESYFYDITFIKSTIMKHNVLEYKRTDYVNKKLRGLSYTEIADKYVKYIEDIYELPVDIKYKLNILLYKEPTKYLNYIRNDEQCKYKRGAHNS